VRVLGIDTATRHASIGFCRNGEVIAEATEHSSRHAVSVLPLIERVLATAGVGARDLDAIAVSRGPGSFTGLRVGLSVAKGLACATGARVVGVPTLEALVKGAGRSGVGCSLLDARRGEFYAASFEVTPAAIRRLSDDAVLTLEALMGIIPAPCWIVGDAEPACGEVLRARFGAAIEFLPFETFGPRGGVVAALGASALQAGGGDDVLSLEPIYIQACQAERALG
jgi:tRNA threonylcarbamoyladenosine biosynthesis protein TsaB